MRTVELIVSALILCGQSPAPPSVSFWNIGGAAAASCGEYLEAATSERTNRPPGASAGFIYDRGFQDYAGTANGFLSGANWMAAVAGMPDVDRNAGQTTDIWGRMGWLENYCRAHPLDKFIIALTKLHESLVREFK